MTLREVQDRNTAIASELRGGAFFEDVMEKYGVNLTTVRNICSSERISSIGKRRSVIRLTEERSKAIADEIRNGALVEPTAEKHGITLSCMKGICYRHNVSTLGKWQSRGTHRPVEMELDEFIEWANSKGVRDEKTGCLLWTGALTEQGYVRIRWKDGLTRLHQLICRHKYGRDLERSECCLHSCDVRHCYAAEHLRVGTNLDNIKDREDRGRNVVPKGEENGNSKLTNTQAIEIARLLVEGKLSHTEISKTYNVSPSTVSLINKRKRYVQAISKEMQNWVK